MCTTHRTENCGSFEPEVAGVIFDEDHLSAELFINRKYLSVVDEQGTHYLPLPDRHFSSVYNLNGAVQGTASQTPNYTVGYNSTLAFGEARIDSESTITNNGLRFDTAAASIDRNGWSGTTGLFRSQAMTILGDRDMAGVSVATSRRTVLDNHKTAGNDIIVYLPRRSFVSIYREGRLYSSHSYEAGNQTLDTSELPDGAYTVTLKIQEADGETREETRFFSKTPLIPPPGEPTYYAQLGLIREPAGTDSTVPQVTQHPIARAGTLQRLTDNIGVSLSALGVQDRAAIEPGIFWLYQGSQLSTTLLGSTKGDAGVQASYIFSDDKLSIATDFRKTWMSNKAIPGDATLIGNLTQASLTISYAFTASLTAGIKGSYAMQAGMDTVSSIGPYAQWNIWQQGESTLSFTADAAKTGSQNQVTAFLHFSHRIGNYGVTGAAGAGFGQGSTGPSGNLHVWHDDPTPGDALLVAAGVDGDKNDKTLSSDAKWHNDFGQVEGGVQKAFGQFGSPFTYGGNFSFNAAQLADDLRVGGSDNEKAAVIVSTAGDADGSINIYVNNSLRSTVNVNGKQTLYLTPFHKYNIRIAPAKGGLMDYDSSNRLVTLYPGNVTELNWEINKFYVVAGHVTTVDGKALQNAILQETKAQVTTDEKGRVQAEISKPNVLTFVTQDNEKCVVHPPQNVPAVHGVLLYHDNLICEPLTETASQ